MKKITIKTVYQSLPADIYTLSAIYLRLRDRFKDAIVFENNTLYTSENNFSCIGINAIAGIEVPTVYEIKYNLPGKSISTINYTDPDQVAEYVCDFMQNFELADKLDMPVSIAQGLFGYTIYNGIQFCHSIDLTRQAKEERIPLMKYNLYQYVIVFNHLKNQLFLCENKIDGLSSQLNIIEGIVKNKDVPVYPFKIKEQQISCVTDEQCFTMLKHRIESCLKAKVSQLAFSRLYQQQFVGDEFNLYRALRTINPEPYMFYFDYGDYKLFGLSSKDKRTDQNNNVMVDTSFRSEAKSIQEEDMLKYDITGKSKSHVFEQTALAGIAENSIRRIRAQKNIINKLSEINPYKFVETGFSSGKFADKVNKKFIPTETHSREYYGSVIGFLRFNQSCAHALATKTFLSKNNTLKYQASVCITADSCPGDKMKEMSNKLAIMQNAITLAEEIVK